MTDMASMTAADFAHLSLSMAHRRAAAFLRTKHVASPVLDARLLLQKASGHSALSLIMNDKAQLNEHQAQRFYGFVQKRAQRLPMSRLMGQREFYGVAIYLNEATLDPRPDSEILVTAMLNKINEPQNEIHILDMGTGSGCLLLAFLHHAPRAMGLGVDISRRALHQARINAGKHNLRGRCFFRHSDWFASVHERFDMIMCNPPYVSADDWARLEPEVRCYEPRRALLADDEGFGFYPHIMAHAERHLTPSGWLGCEIGAGQAKRLNAKLCAKGWRNIETYRDLSGIVRVIMAQKPL